MSPVVLLEDGTKQANLKKTAVQLVRTNLNDKNHGKGYLGPSVLDEVYLLLMRWTDSDFQSSFWLRIGALHY